MELIYGNSNNKYRRDKEKELWGNVCPICKDKTTWWSLYCMLCSKDIRITGGSVRGKRIHINELYKHTKHLQYSLYWRIYNAQINSNNRAEPKDRIKIKIPKPIIAKALSMLEDWFNKPYEECTKRQSFNTRLLHQIPNELKKFKPKQQPLKRALFITILHSLAFQYTDIFEQEAHYKSSMVYNTLHSISRYSKIVTTNNRALAPIPNFQVSMVYFNITYRYNFLNLLEDITFLIFNNMDIEI